MTSSSSSSSLPRTYRYHVFPSFHGPDVRKTCLSHLRRQLNSNGITMFDDQRIERSQTISPALKQAIRESRISIILLSKNYASSRWCLEELVEILSCKEHMEQQIVMTIFHGVDPPDVRKQTGDFGSAFRKTCEESTENEKQRWSQALTDVSNIAGEHFLNWDNESNMIEKIARDVSERLNVTPSGDFDGMVGLEVHIKEISPLLCLESDEVRMVGIYGPAGIGKTTIARALQSLYSSKFQLICFMGNLRKMYYSGLDEYGLKLCLQEKLLSRILNQRGIRICHLGVLKERLCDQRVLIILDDVENLTQLEALANETTWFGPGSRIIVTTENQELLQQHGIKSTYHVGFPSQEEALEIFCIYAFKQTSPQYGFEKLAKSVTELCGNLPLGLRVVGSSLRGKKMDKWEDVLLELETSLDQDIERVLRVGYDSLHEKDQALFLYIAVFFNHKDRDHMRAMLDDSNLNVRRGLKILTDKSLIDILGCGKILMHKLLQNVGRQVLHRQEPWKRQILIDAQQICDILENDTGTSNVMGISFDISEISEVFVSEGSLKKMRNIRLLSIYKTRSDRNSYLHIPDGIEFPPRLRFLHWEAYPGKSLPPKFRPEYLVELNMQSSELKKLWQGTQPLLNLKKMVLKKCRYLKELPDLSKATNLERLDLNSCESLVELPSSFSELHKLKVLIMWDCKDLEDIPTNINLASLEWVFMNGCSRLGSFPNFSTKIEKLFISHTTIEELPASVKHWPRLSSFALGGSGNLKTLTHLPDSVTILDLSFCGFARLPDCIKDLCRLRFLLLSGCRNLLSLPELPDTIKFLFADDCQSLESISCQFSTTHARLLFTNCFKLDKEARRAIIQQSFLKAWACLPGGEVPSEFNHRAIGNSVTILQEGEPPFSASFRFKVCLVFCRNQTREAGGLDVRCSLIGKNNAIKGDAIPIILSREPPGIRRNHLCILHFDMLDKDRCLEVDREIVIEFSSASQDIEIIQCGVRIYTDKSNDEMFKEHDGWSYLFGPSKDYDDLENNDSYILHYIVNDS